MKEPCASTTQHSANNRRYVVIAPGRNEAAFMRRTLDSLTSQTVRPLIAVIVDDGSTDDTPGILEEYAARYPWFRVVCRHDRGFRSVGPGVIEAFYAGLETVDLDATDYICKLDLDLVLPPGYFEELMATMEANRRLGCVSGKAYYPGETNPKGEFGKELVPEAIGDEVTVGASKFYRVACFKQIGGFVRQVMWDGIDCHRARMLGWQVRSVDTPSLRFIHLRPMGSSHGNIWQGRKRHGFGQWFMGTGLIFMTASVIYRFPFPPVGLGSLAIYLGYLESMFKRLPRYGNDSFRRFLQRYQLESLLLGKRRAAARAERRAAGVWSPLAEGQFSMPTLPQADPTLLRGRGD